MINWNDFVPLRLILLFFILFSYKFLLVVTRTLSGTYMDTTPLHQVIFCRL